MSNVSFSKFSNIARPYAVAAFEHARDKKQLPEWKAFFESAAYMAQNTSVMRVLANPETQPQKLFELFRDVLASQINAEQTNFLHLLANNDRLNVLPEISELFNAYYAALEKMSNVRVTTAVDIEDEFRKKLIQALTKRMKHEVTLEWDVDPAIIGGAILRMGDRVIDGSIREQLAKILEFSLR